jgi:hypothetical protein
MLANEIHEIVLLQKVVSRSCRMRHSAARPSRDSIMVQPVQRTGHFANTSHIPDVAELMPVF